MILMICSNDRIEVERDKILYYSISNLLSLNNQRLFEINIEYPKIQG